MAPNLCEFPLRPNRRWWHLANGGSLPLPTDQALSVVLLGLVLVAVAAVVWETSERLCPDPRFHWLRYLRLHSIWHLAIGYGVFLLLQASDWHEMLDSGVGG